MAPRLARAVLAPASKAFTRTSEWNTKIRRVSQYPRGGKGVGMRRRRGKEKRRGGREQGETGALTGIAKGERARIGEGWWTQIGGEAALASLMLTGRRAERSNLIQKKEGSEDGKRTEQATSVQSVLPTPSTTTTHNHHYYHSLPPLPSSPPLLHSPLLTPPLLHHLQSSSNRQI